RTTDSLSLLPVYGALSYQLPMPFRLQVFLKLGGGAAQVEVRPVNKIGWDPLLFAGMEFSIQAAKSFRVGLRIDYDLVYERNKNRQDPADILIYGGTTDPRYMSNRNFQNTDGRFFNFGLMMSFYL
ncbi:MAG: hypothetical protein HY042_09530, partial [Spirochaetia bacterium]|nr:hypothetical protein [Spirochaetia bacterium]